MGIDAAVGNAIDFEPVRLLPKLFLVDSHLLQALVFLNASVGLQQLQMAIQLADQHGIAVEHLVSPLQRIIVNAFIVRHISPVFRIGGHIHEVHAVGDFAERQVIGFRDSRLIPVIRVQRGRRVPAFRLLHQAARPHRTGCDTLLHQRPTDLGFHLAHSLRENRAFALKGQYKRI